MSSPKRKQGPLGEALKIKARASTQQLVAPSADKAQKIVPPGQWQLTDKELDEDVTCILYADRPKLSSNVVQFDYQERAYKPVSRADNDHVDVHFSLESYVDFTDLTPTSFPRVQDVEVSLPSPTQNDGRAGREHNYFNFTDRAAQTSHNAMKDRGGMTDTIGLEDFQALANQSIISDAYETERLQKERISKGREKEKVGLAESVSGLISRPQSAGYWDHDQQLIATTLPKFKILERMVNQPLYDDVNFDFRYWQTPISPDIDYKGLSPLPLWKFHSASASQHQPVTALCWSEAYPDLLAVGHGSFEHVSNLPGRVACFSLKNPTNPEYTFDLEAGVTSLDFNKTHPSLLAIGMSNGSVLVQDMRNPASIPICKTDIGRDRSVPIMTAQIRWHPKDTLTGDPRLYTVSNNGMIQLWNLTQNGLVEEHVIALHHTVDDKGRPSTAATQASDVVQLSKLSLREAVRNAMTTCLDLRPQNNRMFLVGTEEGSVVTCDRGYNSQQLGTIEAHHLSVHAVNYNPRCPTLFLSAGSDWSVKVWREGISEPLAVFDLGSSVGDAAWSPMRASVFAAVTSSGKLCIFDILERKDGPVMEQQLVKRHQVTKIRFNPSLPILAAADSRGHVFSMKVPDHLQNPGLVMDEEKEVQQLLRTLRVMT